MALTFVDTHNMIAHLTKSDASKGFEQILDFLNASVIQYALTVNPTIYVSCIKQFWSSVSIKKENEVMRLQALIDRKNVIITEDTVQEALHLDDAESIDCLPNEEIFAELARMGYEKPSTKLTFYKAFFSAQWKFLIHTILQCMSAKRTAWNEFSSSMASTVICLSTAAQVGDLTSYTTKYTSLTVTQKVFANMRRVGKGFYRVNTPLFEGMLVPQQATDDVDDVVADNVPADDVADVVADHVIADVVAHAAAEPTSPSLIPTTTPPPPQQEEVDAEKEAEVADKDAEVVQDADVQGSQEESQAQAYHIDLEYVDKVLSMHDDEPEPAELKEVIEVVTTVKLMTKVVTAATTTITTAPSTARRRKGVVIRDPKETATPSTIVHSEPKSKDKGKGIMVQEPKPLKKKAHIEQDEAYARELEAELNKNINWDHVVEQVKRKEKEDNVVLRYQALKRKPQTEAHARKNMMVYKVVFLPY
nr:hypothetical protein [Tanacetum cinerariifolium]